MVGLSVLAYGAVAAEVVWLAAGFVAVLAVVLYAHEAMDRLRAGARH
ncbi:MAG: hypothetical protein QOJ35_1950 [Solirubrobacteraceae bacterium]|nr:hypothetical protein [Solirubrobacteraceae bacterium]